jgi:hypothetical protein
VTDIKQEYGDLVDVLRDLGRAIIPARAAQYEAPPQSAAAKEKNDRGVRNPTLEIVLDERRSAVSTEITATAAALRQARVLLTPHPDALRAAVARWEGHPPEGTQSS